MPAVAQAILIFALPVRRGSPSCSSHGLVPHGACMARLADHIHPEVRMTIPPITRWGWAVVLFAATTEPVSAQPVTYNTGANFSGSAFASQSNSFPPDTMGAVGPNTFVEMIN